MGIKIRAACPKGYEPAKDILKDVAGSASIFSSPADAVKGADVIYTDVWTSMGNRSKQSRFQDISFFKAGDKRGFLNQPGMFYR